MILAWWGADWQWTRAELEPEESSQKGADVALPVGVEKGNAANRKWATADFWRTEVAKKHPDNKSLARMVSEPWFGSMLKTVGTNKIWAGNRRRLLKELSESWSVLLRVRNLLQGAGMAGDHTGAGITVFDVCCGKGIAAIMLASAYPDAKIVMVDSDDNMKMEHVDHLGATDPQSNARE